MTCTIPFQQGTFYNGSDFCAPILEKLDHARLIEKPFLLATYGVEALCLVLILLGLFILCCENKLKGEQATCTARRIHAH